jgi:aspartate kinase
VALAYKLGGVCEIYTDVDGIYCADPRKLKNAKKLSQIHYEEMLELASLGAQVMHSRSIELGQKYGIPIYVGLSNSSIKGTMIREVEAMESKPITGIATSNEDISVTVRNANSDINILSRLFESIADRKISIDMISQTSPDQGYVNISFTTSKDDEFTIDEIMKELKREVQTIKVQKEANISKVSVVGMGMRNESGVASKVFKLFADNSINFKQVTTSEISISYTIDSRDTLKAVNVLCEAFNL